MIVPRTFLYFQDNGKGKHYVNKQVYGIVVQTKKVIIENVMELDEMGEGILELYMCWCEHWILVPLPFAIVFLLK
jgi:hypothetical protein